MRRHRVGLVALICAAVLGATGCAGNGAVRAGDAAAGGTASAPSSPSPAVSSAAPLPIPDGYDPGRDARADIQAALQLAATDHREVLLDFGANWCPDCNVLDKLFRSPDVEPVLQKYYHVVAIDVGKFDRNLDVAKRYVNLQSAGIPALVVLSPDGTIRTATNDGAFANARTMTSPEVSAFLTRWAPPGH
jgi:thiol-disulfide isomerase/thioredoxin